VPRPELLIAQASAATSRSAWDEAARLWKSVRLQFPDERGAYFEHANALIRLEQIDDAEATFAAGMKRFPDDPWLAIHHGWMAMHRADWAEASRRWGAIRDRFPDQPAAYYEGGLALQEAGRLDEADAVLAAGMTLFPGNIEVFRHYALNANRRGDRAEAQRRWQELCSRFPNNESGKASLERASSDACIERSQAFIKAGQFDTAEATLAEGMRRQPDDPQLAIHHSWIAMRRADWAEASRRWGAIRDRFPDQPAAYYEGGLTLRDAGRLDEADAVLAAGVRLFPRHNEMLRHYALNADRRRSWAEALARWEDLCRLFPEDEFGAANLQRCAYEARFDLLTTGGDVASSGRKGRDAPNGPALNGPDGDAEPSKLLMGFEGLGSNCEFGFVQRHFGAEPLSLFRWSATTAGMLRSALDLKLEGIGDVGHTTISHYHSGELILADTRFFTDMHTHVHHTAVDLDAFLPEMCQKLRFLRKRLLKTLEEGEKIFLRASLDFSEQDATGLLGSLQRYAENRLLCVCDADQNHPSGTVEQLTSDLAIGYVKLEDPPFSHLIDFAGWLEVCRKARAAFGQARNPLLPTSRSRDVV